MATFNLCNQFDQIAEGKVVYYGTEHTEYADLEQPKEEKPKKKFSAGRLFNKFLGGLVAVVAVSAVVGLAVAYAASVVLTGGASLAALPVIAAGAGVVAAGFTAYRGGQMLEAQYQNDKANQEEGSWGDYIGGALINTANIGAQEAVLAILFLPAEVVGGRLIGAFVAKYSGKLFAKLAAKKAAGRWFKMGRSKVFIEKPPAKPMKRPPWWVSEEKIRKRYYPNYKKQQSFLGRKSVRYGTKNSTRPDLFKKRSIIRWRGRAVEIKNYDLKKNADALVKEVQRQLNQRKRDLPKWTKQIVEIDATGQENVSEKAMKEIAEAILQDAPKGVKIIFRRM